MNGTHATVAFVLTALLGGCAATDTVAVIDGAQQCVGTLGSSFCSETVIVPSGLCVCEDVAAGDALVVDALESQQGSVSGFGGPGSAAIDGALNGVGSVDVEGDLSIAGQGGITLSNAATLVVGGDLEDQGVLMGVSVSVAGDASVGSTLSATDLAVGGTLTTPAGTAIDAPTDGVAAMETAEVSVAPKCPCAAEARPDVVAEIHARRSRNDNASAGLETYALDGFSDVRAIELPCGDFHLSRVAGSGSLELTTPGWARVFVDADVALEGALSVRLVGGGRLDLFVADGFRVGGPLTLGDPARPASVRVFVAGGSPLVVEDDATIAGLVYAPAAELITQGTLEVFGSLLVRRAAPAGPLTVHHDPGFAAPLAECQ